MTVGESDGVGPQRSPRRLRLRALAQLGGAGLQAVDPIGGDERLRALQAGPTAMYNAEVPGLPCVLRAAASVCR